MNHTKKQTKQKLIELEKSGLEYTNIAEALNKEGHVTPTRKKPWTDATVSRALRSLGVKRRNISAEPSRKQRGPATTGAGNKWELLRAIENCDGLERAVKRTLLDMVFQELNK